MEWAEVMPGYTSRTLLHWLEAPSPTRVLGNAILLELRHAGHAVLVDFIVTDEINNLVHLPSK